MAASLTAALLLTADRAHAEPLHVGQDRWVHVTKSIEQHYTNGTEDLRPGDTCVISRGAELVLVGSGVVYKHKDALGTECPNGTEVDLSPSQVFAQNERYQAFSKRRAEVIKQIIKMPLSIGGPAKEANGKWVDIVNPKPIKQIYSNGEETLRYGDECVADGQAQEIGQLITGEAVMLLSNSRQIGTECPTDTLYLQTANVLPV